MFNRLRKYLSHKFAFKCRHGFEVPFGEPDSSSVCPMCREEVAAFFDRYKKETK